MPVSERAADKVLAIPIYPELTRGQIEHVAHSISAFYKA
jgi:dTDP-4-amino-4,6-dideoxygalactose transaminase